MSQQLPHSRFVQGLRANLAYWQTKIEIFEAARIAQFEREFSNLHHAIEMALVVPDLRVLAAQLVQQCFFWVEGTGYIQQWLNLLQHTIACLPAAEHRLQFLLLKQQGQLHRLLQQPEAAEKAFAHCFSLLPVLNDRQAEAELYLNQCQILVRQQKFAAAEEMGRSALSLAVVGENGRIHALVLQALGNIALLQGQLVKAESQLNEALSLSFPRRNVTDDTRTLTLLAFTQMRQNNSLAGLQTLQLVEQKLAGTLFLRDQIELYINLGSCFFSLDRFSEAETAFQRGLDLLEGQHGFLSFKALLAYNMGHVLHYTNNVMVALPHLQKSARYWQQLADVRMLLKTYFEIAQVYDQLNQTESAASILQELLAVPVDENASDEIKQIRTKTREKLLLL